MATLLAKPTSAESMNTFFREPLSMTIEIERLFGEIRRKAFAIFENRGRIDGFDFDDWIKAESEVLRYIPIEMEVSDKEVVVKAEVPGFKAAEISITVEPEYLNILAESAREESQKTGKQCFTDFSDRNAYRRTTLPNAVKPEESWARLRNGLLEIHMPKAVPAKSTYVRTAA